jgi:puromycin-sensitive aminopeptidase
MISHTLSTADEQPSDYRLPGLAVPRRYEIYLRPDFASEIFTGTERVTIEVLEPTDVLLCNAAELEISDVRLRHVPVEEIASSEERPEELDLVAEARTDEVAERVAFDLPQTIDAGRYVLDLRFNGKFNDLLRGFYLSKWTDDSGRERAIATTQFQSTDARRAFPCWDEPALKSVFSITLDVPPGLTAVSNSPEKTSTNLQDGWRRITFADTPVMSTYIVAFVIGELQATEAVDVDGIPLRVFHVPGRSHLTSFAIDVASHALRFYSSWFGIPYPGEKLDLIGIPDRGGAMENLGAAIFVESALLIDERHAAKSELEKVAEVIEHEIAHMWFGDLVTMKWWNGLWLNEAFASFMSLLCLDDFRPEYKCWVNFGSSRDHAMFVDALHSTRAIEFEVRQPDEAEAMYDVLTYQKGASVVRMLEQFVGPERFRAGVSSYLSAHKFSNTDTADLWEAIEHAASDEPIREMMRSWIYQGGYPLLRVGRDRENRIRLEQRRFHLLRRTAGSTSLDESEDFRDPEDNPDQWMVPCILGSRTSSRSGDEIRTILTSSVTTVAAPGGSSDGLVVNSGGSGFFRVLYTPELLSAITSDTSQLQALEQFNLVSDSWACALSGVAPLASFFALLESIDPTWEPSVYGVVAEALQTLDHVVADDDRPTLQRWIRALLSPVLNRVGWEPVEGESEQLSTLRSLVIQGLGNLGEDPTVIEQSRTLFHGERPGQELAADTAGAILAVVAAHSPGREVEVLLERYRRPRDPQDEQRYLVALSQCRDQTIAGILTALCRGDIKNQDAGARIRMMMANRYLGDSTWRFLQAHWDELLMRHEGKSLWRLLSGAGWLIDIRDDGSAPLADEVQAFLTTLNLDGMQRTVDQTVESLQVRLAFARQERAGLSELLRDR